MPNSDKSVFQKLRLLHAAEELNNVTKACEALGYSRDSYYRFRALYERGGEAALRNLSRKKPVVKNRVASDVEEAVVALAFAHPGWGQARAARDLGLRGVLVSSSGVRSVWQRYDLETKTKRAIAIATRAAREGLPLSDEQRVVIGTLRRQGGRGTSTLLTAPGEVCYQDLVLVGDHPRLGPLYQHVVVDGYSRYAFARLEAERDGTSPADFLLSTVLPWFHARGLSIDTVRADRREPFGGKGGTGYRLALDRSGTALTYRMATSRAGQDPASAFSNIVRTAFYQRLFRAGISEGLNALNTQLADWLSHYNEERVETAAYCYGHTPAEVIAGHLRSQRFESGAARNGPDRTWSRDTG